MEPGAEPEEEVHEPDPEGVPPAFRSFGLATDQPLARPTSGSNGDGASGSGLTDAQRRSARDLERVGPDDDDGD